MDDSKTHCYEKPLQHGTCRNACPHGGSGSYRSGCSDKKELFLFPQYRFFNHFVFPGEKVFRNDPQFFCTQL